MNRASCQRQILKQGLSKRFRFRNTHLVTDGLGTVLWRDEFVGKGPWSPIDMLSIVLPANPSKRCVARVTFRLRKRAGMVPLGILADAARGLNEGTSLHLCLRVRRRELPVLDLSVNSLDPSGFPPGGLIISLNRLVSSNAEAVGFAVDALHILYFVHHYQDKSGLWQDILSRSEQNETVNKKDGVATRSTSCRDSGIVAMLKEYHDHRCQLCGTNIPSPDGRPYVEAHHIVPVCDDGSDIVSNILIVCPNCHKLLHLWDGHPALTSSGASS